MDPSLSTLDNPETLPIRRSQNISTDPGAQQDIRQSQGSNSSTDSAAGPEARAEVDPTVCPRCGSKLINPQELGWCPKCSYCRSLEADQAAARLVTESSRLKPTSHFGEFGELIARMPAWGWRTIGVICAILALSFFASFLLPQDDSLARALISLVALVVSIVAIFGVNLWALFLLGPRDGSLGPMNVFLFVGLWRQICESLPTTRRQFSSILWCITVIISACFIVGGLDYWWEHYKPNRVAKVDILSAATALAKGAKAKARSLEESIDDFAKMAELRKEEEERARQEKLKAAARETVQCVIIGYTENAEKQLDGLLVAAILNDRIRYAGIVRKGLTPKEVKRLVPLLKPLIQEKSYIPGLSADGKAEVGNAFWVKPNIFCEVTHEDYDENKHFTKSEFKTLLSDNR
jgi:hypothetical protein